MPAVATALPWRQVPAGSPTREKGHRRAGTRTLKAARLSSLDFPHAIVIERTVEA